MSSSENSKFKELIARKGPNGHVESLGERGAILALLHDIYLIRHPDQVGEVLMIDLDNISAKQQASAALLVKLATRLTDEQALKPLQDALHHKDSYIRQIAFFALCEAPAHLITDLALEELIFSQSKIDAEHSNCLALEFLLRLLEQLKSKGKAEPFLVALKSKTHKVLIFAITSLLELGNGYEILLPILELDLSDELVDMIVAQLQKDAELSVSCLIKILDKGKSVSRANAARILRHFPDEDAVAALAKWDEFLKKELANKTPKCHRCGKEAAYQLENGNYWCSWCGDSFTPDDAFTKSIVI